MKKAGPDDLDRAVGRAIDAVDQTLHEQRPILKLEELGTITFVGNGIARISGLRHARSEELLILPDNKLAIAFNLDPDEVAAIMLDKSDNIKAGEEVRKTGRVMDVPVGEELLGRVVDAMGRPLDEGQPIHGKERRPIEREAPAIMDRAAVNTPLQTGILAVDAMIPIGRGQRELILGDRQIGKTAIALDTMINQIDKGILCVYCAIGQQRSALSRVISDLRDNGAMDHCIIVVATGEDPPGHNFIAPYAATSMAEYFMEKGRDVLIVYDDLTRHARSYRELSLLLRRPPGREAFPGDIFYIHSRLLERSTHLKEEFGGGSLTALPIVETEAQNISAYIPTNLISITDGQVYLSPDLFQRGQLPAVDEGRSVSRVGGKTQLKAYRSVAGDLRLSYSLFEELETFSRIGTRLDEKTKKILAKGERVREVLKQSQFEPMSACEQVAILVAVTNGAFTDIALDEIEDIEREIRSIVKIRLTEVCSRIEANEDLSKEDRDALTGLAREIVQNRVQGERYAQP